MKAFRTALLDWYRRVRRDLPWRHTRDPYAIWISEVMLQQTRVAAVIPYYQRFLERFPDVRSLAAAPEADLLAAWAGLGYYSRGRNLQRAAKLIGDGPLPSTYDELRALPGVGDYTAAAVASIAFGQPHAAIDGNVARVLARVTLDENVRPHAEALLDREHPGEFNEAMMELGATVCLPKNPLCEECPVASMCLARSRGLQKEIPSKRRRPDTVRETEQIAVVVHDDKVLLWQRPVDASKLAGFWDVPACKDLPDGLPLREIGRFRHSITHHLYTCVVFLAENVPCVTCKSVVNCDWLPLNFIESMPLSTRARKALRCYRKNARQTAR